MTESSPKLNIGQLSHSIKGVAAAAPVVLPDAEFWVSQHSSGASLYMRAENTSQFVCPMSKTCGFDAQEVGEMLQKVLDRVKAKP